MPLRSPVVVVGFAEGDFLLRARDLPKVEFAGAEVGMPDFDHCGERAGFWVFHQPGRLDKTRMRPSVGEPERLVFAEINFRRRRDSNAGEKKYVVVRLDHVRPDFFQFFPRVDHSEIGGIVKPLVEPQVAVELNFLQRGPA